MGTFAVGGRPVGTSCRQVYSISKADLERHRKRGKRCWRHGWLDNSVCVCGGGGHSEGIEKHVHLNTLLHPGYSKEKSINGGCCSLLRPSLWSRAAVQRACDHRAPGSTPVYWWEGVCRRSLDFKLNISNLPLLCRKYCSAVLITMASRKPHTILRAQKDFFSPCGFHVIFMLMEKSLHLFDHFTHSVLLYLFSTFHFISFNFLSVFIPLTLTLARQQRTALIEVACLRKSNTQHSFFFPF